MIFFLRHFKFLSYRSYICLVRVTSGYFILFVLIVKGVISLATLSVCITFEYKKATDLFKLILYPNTLLKLFISCRSSVVEFWCHIDILSYHLQMVIFTSSFPIFIPLTTFCCLIALARTSSTVLGRERVGSLV